MKVYISNYWPEKFDDTRWMYSLNLLPGIEIIWLGGLKHIRDSWLFWDILLDLDKGE